jgi:hypothetical protein
MFRRFFIEQVTRADASLTLLMGSYLCRHTHKSRTNGMFSVRRKGPIYTHTHISLSLPLQTHAHIQTQRERKDRDEEVVRYAKHCKYSTVQT